MHIAGTAQSALRTDRVLQLLAQQRGFAAQLFELRGIIAGQPVLAGCPVRFRTL